MEKPIKLKLVAVEGDRYKLQYPNLTVPIEVNKELFFKFRESKEYVVDGDPVQFPFLVPSYSGTQETSIQA